MSGSDVHRSGAGWSEQDEAPSPGRSSEKPQPAGFATTEQNRYQRGDEIGRGGMGRVFQSSDRRLGRDVALKEIAPDRTDPGFVDRLIREARLTAYLDHPNIVPVYDAGETEGGRIFYTMRLIRGRSLALAIDDAPDREALLRHYLDTCHAVAFAHSRGVVHRDLKPANIMVGAFGETQVVDWGLAGLVEPKGNGDHSLVEQLGIGPRGAVGTKAYMAPEQATGAPAAPSADVYSLGVVLGELTTDASDSALRAIADKASATDATDRYANASELSEDVARYLDGRRVLAHNYSARELLARLVRLWRVPLVIGLVAFLTLVVTISLMVTRIARERGRAIDAEASTRLALTETRRALNRHALAAFHEGTTAEAEVIAAHALRHDEFADARGVLAAAHAGARPTSASLWTLPGCNRAEPSRSDTALCVGNGSVSLWRLAQPPRQQWRISAPDVRAYLSRSRVTLIGPKVIRVLDSASGKLVSELTHQATYFGLDRATQTLVAADNRHVWTYDLVAGHKRDMGRPCDPDLVTAVAATPTRVVALCRSGAAVVFATATGERTHTLSTPFSAARPSLAVAMSDDGNHVAVGGAQGGVSVLRVDDKSPATMHTLISGPVQQLSFFQRDYLVVVPESGPASVHSTRGGAALMRLPAGAHTIVVQDDDLIAAGARVARWTVPADRLVGSVFVAGAGLSSAAVSPNRRVVVAARGDGVLSSWARSGGLPIANLPVDKAVLKRVAYTRDGASIVVATASPGGSALVDAEQWRVSRIGAAKEPLRRVVVLDRPDGTGETAVGIGYGSGISTWPVGGDTVTTLAGPSFIDADVASDGTFAVLLDKQGGVWRLGHALRLRKLRTIEGAVAVTSGSDDTMAVATAGGVHLFVGESTIPRWLPSTSGGLTDVAISRDGKLVSAASRRGTVDVWRSDTAKVVAVLRGHRQRVAYVAYTGARELISASWDGTVRLWNLDVVDVPAQQLAQRARRAWGLSLDDALRAWPLGSVVSGSK